MADLLAHNPQGHKVPEGSAYHNLSYLDWRCCN